MDSSRLIHICRSWRKVDNKGGNKVATNPYYQKTHSDANLQALFVPAGADEIIASYGEMRGGIYQVFLGVSAKSFVDMSCMLVWDASGSLRYFNIKKCEVFDSFGPQHVELLVEETKIVPEGVS
jgi:hypothetical protein